MKKFLASLLMLASAVLLVGQAEAQTIHYGIKGGVDFDNMRATTSSGSFNNDSLALQTQGIYINIKLGPVSLQPELLYSRHGASWLQREEPEGRLYGNFKYDSIELPVLVKYSFLSGPARPCVFVGPSFSYIFRPQFGGGVDTPESYNMDSQYSYDYGSYIKNTEFAAIGGIGIDYRLSRVIVSLDVRYRLGLSNINEASMGEMTGISSFKNRGVSVMIGLGF